MSRLPFAPDVEELEVDVEAATLSFRTRPGTRCDPEALRSAVREAGFDLGAVQLDGDREAASPPQAPETRLAE